MSQPIRAVRRFFHWRGRQRPMLGLGLGATDPLDLAAEPERIRESWTRLVELAEDLSLEVVALPSGVWRNEDMTCELLRQAESARVACVLPLDASCYAMREIDVEQRIRRFARAHRGILASIGLRAPEDAERLEDVLIPLLERTGVPALVTAGDPLGGLGRTARELSRTATAVGTDIGPHDPNDPASTLAAALAVRPPDRPSVVSIEPQRVEEFGDQAWASLLAASGVTILRVGRVVDPGQIRAALAPVSAVLSALPNEVSEPRGERARVLVLDDDRGAGQPTDAIIAALLLLHRTGQLMTSLCFESVADPSDRQALIWVPAHGGLGSGAWRRCWSLAHSGSLVVITGLCVETDTDREFLAKLGARATVNTSRADLPPWLRGRPLLETGGSLSTHDVGSGLIGLFEGPVELRPDSEQATALVEKLLATAELVADVEQPGRFARNLQFAQGSLRGPVAGPAEWISSSSP